MGSTIIRKVQQGCNALVITRTAGLNYYRGGMLEVEEAALLTMYYPNVDDSTVLEEQMDPNPTLDEGEQILEAY